MGQFGLGKLALLCSPKGWAAATPRREPDQSAALLAPPFSLRDFPGELAALAAAEEGLPLAADEESDVLEESDLAAEVDDDSVLADSDFELSVVEESDLAASPPVLLA